MDKTQLDKISAEAHRAVLFKKQQVAAIARLRPDVFQQFILRDETSGSAIKLSPSHKEWHPLISKHDRLVLWSHVEAAKSQAISISRVLWELGNNRRLRCCVLSNTHGQAVKLVRAIANHIESNDRLHQVWRDFKPHVPWTDSAITIARGEGVKDPSVQAMGMHGALLGARLDLVVVDDVLDYENTRTPEARQKTWDWFQSTVMGRLTEKARVIVVGTAFHPEDLLHRLAAQPGWVSKRYPVVSEAGEPQWPERWSLERVDRKRLELGPLEFSRQMLCLAYDDSAARFKKEWIDACLARGKDKEWGYALASVPLGCKVFTGVDLAVQQHAAADHTVLFTVLFYQNGDREILDIQRGKWSGPDIVTRIADTHKRYQGIIIVENNAAQKYLEQYTRDQGIPVRGFTTGRNKANPDFGVESLAAEMSSGKWIFPCRGGISRELGVFMSELLQYDPASHTGDTIMGCWFAREGARMSQPKAQQGRLNLLNR